MPLLLQGHFYEHAVKYINHIYVSIKYSFQYIIMVINNAIPITKKIKGIPYASLFFI